MPGQRLDQWLVERKHFKTRARARDAILRGTVTVDGTTCLKPGQKTRDAAAVSVDDPAAGYVSRAALKLVAGLEAFQVNPAGRCCLDVGASTGGFTQVLLGRGAHKVHAIDVGHGQLHESIAGDPRVVMREGLNARELTGDDLGGDRPDLIVSDVSFISLKLALPPALRLAAPDAEGVFLVKPQFEAGRGHIGKGGLVDNVVAEDVARDLQNWLNSVPGWSAGNLVPSPVSGGDGNREWLLHGKRQNR